MSEPKTKIVAIGAPTFDAFLVGDALAAKRDVRTHDYVEEFPLGKKLYVDNVVFSLGGNATNAAVTFARQGFDTSVIGKIGDDLPGREILQILKNEGVSHSHVSCDLDGMTSYSTILLATNGERTILNFPGVKHQLFDKDINWERLSQADWFYISDLPPDLSLLKHLLDFAASHSIKVAYNPSAKELANPEFKSHLGNLEIFIVNKQEMEQLLGSGETEALLRRGLRLASYVVITNGHYGSWLAHDTKLYRASLYRDVKVVDRTGAGDAFGSGLAAILARDGTPEEALRFASANSTSVVRQIGSQAGILYRHAKVAPMPIEIKQL